MKKFLLLIIFSQLASCQYKPDTKAIELVKQANKIGSECFYKDTIKANQALLLLNQAIKIDDKYFSAYYSKLIFLTAKKDIDGLLLNNQKMIELRPNQPLWKMQRGLFFDIKGNKSEAEKNYVIGIAEYENLLKTELKKDFNFRMEYLSALETKGDIPKTQLELENISREFPNNEILKAYKAKYKFKTKEELIALWKSGDLN